eukprot:TRINITY_DN1310_c0_g1_i1.p1 TRINITY_DN1310_c0_g1~~TRINITY_DN1310_c0_g1_i1.p1  ORF type:complete len:798 (-),score=216.75 TRINITY_DN1310_c0_g1_i1:54-2447(-)
MQGITLASTSEVSDDSLCEYVLSPLSPWRKKGTRSLVRALLETSHVKKTDCPEKPSEVTKEWLLKMRQRHKDVLEMPLQRYSAHLKPALFRRIRVGTMDMMDEAHESYRQTFDFVETTNTWHDVDTPWRQVPYPFNKIDNPKIEFKEPEIYTKLNERLKDGFTMVVKVSCVATHLEKLDNFEKWWPLLYREKYAKVQGATLAFLWQFAPSWEYDRTNWSRLEALTEYLHSSASGCPEARHIVDFRHKSWYNTDVYDFLKKKRWCLAWLHLNNTDEANRLAGRDPLRPWAGTLPSGWTDRVQTTNFVFIRLFGPLGPSHGTYDKAFLHTLFDGCPPGTTSYVLFGNREEVNNANPVPRPAVMNATDFRTINTKMDFVERIRMVRYKGDTPRAFTRDERLLLNSFYLRFSVKARLTGVKMGTPVGSTHARKWKKDADNGKRSFEWKDPADKKGVTMMHIGLHGAREEDDLWLFLRQLSGFEDLEATKLWITDQVRMGTSIFLKEEQVLVNGAFIRWSEKARASGLLRTSELVKVEKHAGGDKLHWRFSNGAKLSLSVEDLEESQDCWRWFVDLCRVSPEEHQTSTEFKENDPWSDGSWKKQAGLMWKQETFKPPFMERHDLKRQEELKKLAEEEEKKAAAEEEAAALAAQQAREEEVANDTAPPAEAAAAAAAAAGGGGAADDSSGGREKDDDDATGNKRKRSEGEEEPDKEYTQVEEVQLGQWRNWNKKPKIFHEWEKWENNSAPGTFVYRHTETKEHSDLPPPLQATWRVDKDDAGKNVYTNKATGECQNELPDLPD